MTAKEGEDEDEAGGALSAARLLTLMHKPQSREKAALEMLPEDGSTLSDDELHMLPCKFHQSDILLLWPDCLEQHTTISAERCRVLR